jgi:hypothetical protein
MRRIRAVLNKAIENPEDDVSAHIDGSDRAPRYLQLCFAMKGL